MSRDLDRYVDRHITENRLPILLYLVGNDRIIDNAGVIEVLERGASEIMEVIHYPDQTHSIQFDAPDRMVSDMADWLKNSMRTGKEATP